MPVKIDRAAEARGIERGTRQLSMMKPFFNRQVVERITRRDFPQYCESEVLDILNQFKADDDELSWRTRLDALKLSEGNLEKLKAQIGEARRDFREVIMPAETPRIFADVVAYARLLEDEKDRTSEEDLTEFLSWVQKS
jgi:hypothetical protein